MKNVRCASSIPGSYRPFIAIERDNDHVTKKFDLRTGKRPQGLKAQNLSCPDAALKGPLFHVTSSADVEERRFSAA
jgi:hypothetical protein